ncbi:hypothetical protein ABIB25_000765 [Nakamurella sp. UYEF19]
MTRNVGITGGWPEEIAGTHALTVLVAAAPGQRTGIFERNADF